MIENRLKNVKVTVKAPATSANLGGGFDCLGLALKLYHTVSIKPSEVTTVNGSTDIESNLIYKAANAVLSRAGMAGAAAEISSVSDVPRASGLGSSAACIVGGATAANALLAFPLPDEELAEICTALDGHPDNVLPALYGGITAGVICEDGKISFVRADVSDKIKVAVATPDFPLKTENARKALPSSYSRADCVYSLSRAVLAFSALSSGDIDKIKLMGDKLHEPYRIPLIKDFDKVKSAFLADGALNVCVSGSGPSAIAFYPKSAKINAALPDGWTLRTPDIENGRVWVRVEDIVVRD